jgi:hypothetical protein
MAKWADYLITGIWVDDADKITHVMLHEDSETNFSRLGKTSESEVIKLIKQNKTVRTITWNYPSWKKGALVEYATRNGKEYLRTNPNSTEKDNLDNSLRMSVFFN